MAAPAGACESEYTIQPGDTLSRVASKCNTTLAALTEANRVNPRALQLGQVIVIPGAESGVEPVARESSRTRPATDEVVEEAAGYEVRPGDTPSKIAKSLGISVDTLLKANDGMDPTRLRIGQRLNVPDSEEIKRILAEQEAERNRMAELAEKYDDPVLQAKKGEWRLTVDLEADGLAPNETVIVGVRSASSDWIALGQMPADDEGKLVARARIPADLVGEKNLRFAIERPWGDHVSVQYAEGTVSRSQVAEKRGTEETVEHTAELRGTTTVAGKVVSGGGCDLLVTADGESFELSGDSGFKPGARVIVTGAIENGGSRCRGGAGSLHVQTVQNMPRA